MLKKTIIILMLLTVCSGGLMAQTSTTEAGKYVTKAELARIISELSGEKQAMISEFMFSEGLSKEATMADVVEILFQSGLLKKQVNEEKKYLGKPTIKVYK